MRYRKLGNTDIEVSVICLGTMTWGQQNTESQAHEQMSYALDQGVNFFDTAELYPVPARKETSGLTEEYIGTWLSNTGNRDKIILATKICGPGAYTKHIRAEEDYSASTITEALHQSLRRLRTDYIDLYQLHWPARRTNFFSVRGYHKLDAWEDNFLHILESLEKHIKTGKIRTIGISNETPWGMMNYLRNAEKHNLPRIISIQNPYSLLNRSFETGLAEMSIREQVGLLAYSPMAFGRLSGKYEKGKASADARINQFDSMARYNSANSIEATRKYANIAREYGLSLAQMSLAFVNDRSFVTSNIIGATTMSQLRENIASDNIVLSRECLKAIEQVHNLIPDPAP